MRRFGVTCCAALAISAWSGSSVKASTEAAVGYTLNAENSLSESVEATERWWWGLEQGVERRGKVSNARIELDWATIELLDGIVVERRPAADSEIRQVLFEGHGRVTLDAPSKIELRHAGHVLDARDLAIEFERALFDQLEPIELDLIEAPGGEVSGMDRCRAVLTQRAHHGSAAALAAAAAHGERESQSALFEFSERYLHISYDPLSTLEYVVALGSAARDKNNIENYDFCEISGFHGRGEYEGDGTPRHPRSLVVDGLSATVETEVREDRTVAGRATLRLQSFREGLRAFQLNLSPTLKVHSVTERGGAAWGAHQAAIFEAWHKYLPGQDDRLWIYPARHIAAGDESGGLGRRHDLRPELPRAEAVACCRVWCRRVA